MASRRTTTTTTEPPTTVAIRKEPQTSPLILPLVIAATVVVILLCIIVIIWVYRKRKNAMTKIEPAESERLSISATGKKKGSVDSAMKQRIFSIDSERGLSDSENVQGFKTETSEDEKVVDTEKEKGGKREISRSSSKASFKSIALVARYGAGSKHKKEGEKDAKEKNKGEEGETTDSEAEPDSGIDSKAMGVLELLSKPKKQSERSKMAKKHKEDQKTTAIFSTAKKLYEGQISTFKRTNGRQNSAGTQTSPAGSFISIPGLLESADSGSEAHYDTPPPNKNFFVYLVSDANSFYKKDCIGRISLPEDVKQFTLSQLRNYLLRSDDEVLRSVLKNNKTFRFVTETYKFVAQAEQVVNVEDVYLNQGIFVKFSEGQFVPADAKVGMAIGEVNKSSTGFARSTSRRKSRRRHMPHGDKVNEGVITPGPGYESGDAMTEGTSVTAAHHLPHATHGVHGNANTISSMEVNASSPSHVRHHRRRAGRPPSAMSFGGGGGGRDHAVGFIEPNPDAFKRRALEADFSLDEEKITERLRKRHIECISPLPLKYKEAYKRQVLLIMDSRRICDRQGCKFRAMFKCSRCTMAAYCSAKCKKEHWLDHRLVCRRPPWRL